jgi:hypothetical protein
MDVNMEQDPLALGGINERRLVAAFLDFLKTKSEKSDTPAPVRENLEGILVFVFFRGFFRIFSVAKTGRPFQAHLKF